MGTHEAQLLGPDGRFRNATGIGGALLDLPRDPTGVATIPERRNDDNVIVAQLHLFWQQLHNFTLSSSCNAVEPPTTHLKHASLSKAWCSRQGVRRESQNLSPVPDVSCR